MYRHFFTTFLQQFIVLSLVLAPISKTMAADGAVCVNLFLEDGAAITPKKKKNKPTENKTPSDPSALFFDSYNENNLNRYNAAWEISKLGVQQLIEKIYGSENIFYYYMTAILAAENVLIDGPGGGAKTFSIRQAYEAQLNGLNKISPEQKAKWVKDSDVFFEMLLDLIQKDSELEQKSRIFTQQMHAQISETKLIGGVNPFKVITSGNHKIDYSNALINPKNRFAILDELDKGPVSVQMTALSILQERQALFGNTVIQTLLESVAATSNSTLGDLISQALPHEVGGRMALIDRFGIKVHVANAFGRLQDYFILVENTRVSKKENKFVIMDMRGLRPLMSKVKISKELLEAANEIALHMDREYTKVYNEAMDKADEAKTHPDYYPPYSGSTRTNSKMIKIWISAFLTRQLMQGVPFDSIRFEMRPEDLVDLSPWLQQGGPDQIIPKFGVKIRFVQYISKSINMVSSNKKGVSLGYYDPYTQIFQYESAGTGEVRRLKYDLKSKTLIVNNKKIMDELVLDSAELSSMEMSNVQRALSDINSQIQRAHDRFLKRLQSDSSTISPLQFESTQVASQIIAANHVRNSAKRQLQRIQHFMTQFLNVTNMFIIKLQGQKTTDIDVVAVRAEEQLRQENAEKFREKYTQVLKANNPIEIARISAESVQEAYRELTTYFKESEQDIKALLLAAINKNNLLLAGPAGSAKTLKSRLVLTALIEGLSEAKVAEINSVMSEALLRSKLGKQSIWMKQFNPMSTEGEVVGRLDLKKIREKGGYRYNRTGSLSSRSVFFALLDEFNQAPAGVRMSLLSILNEREVFDGDRVLKSNIISIVISTNNTPSEFISSLGDFSSAFPVYDRIQNKAYVFNKLTQDALLDFYTKLYAGVKPKLRIPILTEPLTQAREKIKFGPEEQRLFTEILHQFFGLTVRRSDQEHEMFLGGNAEFKNFFMNTRGESTRSFVAIDKELQGAIVLARVLKGEDIASITKGQFRFSPEDLVAFAELVLTFNNQFKIGYEYDAQGIIQFIKIKTNTKGLSERLTQRDLKSLEHIEYETDQMVSVLNGVFRNFMKTMKLAIMQNPNLYPTAFATRELRQKWLTDMKLDPNDQQK